MFSKKFIYEIVQAGDVPTLKPSNAVKFTNAVHAGEQIYNPARNDTQTVVAVEHWPGMSVVYVAPFDTPSYLANVFIKIEVDRNVPDDHFGWTVTVVNGSEDHITVKTIGLHGKTTLPGGAEHKVCADNVVKVPAVVHVSETVSWKYSYPFGQANKPVRYNIGVIDVEAVKSDGTPVGTHLINVTRSKG